ncbi:lysophospholipid acyltransferase family protein [Candidatus Zixiibacteriota bacterium]
MHKTRSWHKLTQFFTYLFIRLLGVVVTILPRPLAAALMKLGGAITFDVVRIGRQLTLMNLEDAFPDKTSAERRQIGRAAMANLMVSVMDLLRVRFQKREKALSRIQFDPDSEALCRQAMQEGRGVVYVAGHYGNWELLGGRLATIGSPSVAIYQELRNPFLCRELNWIRRKFDIRPARRGVAVREVLKALKARGAALFVADQEADPESGLMVDFFGKPASTFQGPAALAVRYNTPLLATSVHRERGRYQATCERLDRKALADLPADTDEETRIRLLTEAFVQWLEEKIRLDPSQYFWLHRRWEWWPLRMER